MKKISLFFTFLLISLISFALNEEVWVVTNSGSNAYAKSPQDLGWVNPCDQFEFYVDVHIPLGYVNVSKYEWFVNGLSVKTTTDGSDPILVYKVTSNIMNVFCKVTYAAQNGSTTSPSTSTTFTPNVKQLNFEPSIVSSGPSPNYNCTNSVSYSLNQFTCTSFCDGVYSVSSYNITWQAPSGWVPNKLNQQWI